MLRLSFIVPFYNVEPYIEECIRSLYNQDIPWEEYEVICIDDCSPDGSRAIVERLQQEYPTLKLLRTPENLRQGGARNMGLDIAQGKYIWFVDSDDYIVPNCLGKYLQLLDSQELDILNFGFSYDGPLKYLKKPHPIYELGVCSGTEYVFDNNYRWANKCCVVTNAIINKSLLLEKKIFFAEKILLEDNDFSIKMYAYARRVVHISDTPYVYRILEKSSTHSTTSTHYQALCYIRLCRRYTKLQLRFAVKRKWYRGLQELRIYVMRQCVEVLKELEVNEKIKLYKIISLFDFISIPTECKCVFIKAMCHENKKNF